MQNGLAMMSVFAIFVLELFAYRVGVKWMEGLGVDVHDTHGPGVAHVRRFFPLLQVNTLILIFSSSRRVRNTQTTTPTYQVTIIKGMAMNKSFPPRLRRRTVNTM